MTGNPVRPSASFLPTASAACKGPGRPGPASLANAWSEAVLWLTPWAPGRSAALLSSSPMACSLKVKQTNTGSYSLGPTLYQVLGMQKKKKKKEFTSFLFSGVMIIQLTVIKL